MVRKIFSEAFHAGESAVVPDARPDRRVMLILVVVAACVTLIRYLGDPIFFVTAVHNIGLHQLSAQLNSAITFSPTAQLNRLIIWVSVVIFFYTVPAFVLIKLVFRQSLTTYGLSFRNAFGSYKVYLVMLCVMIPLVLYFSGTASFQSRYPFYDMRAGESPWPNLVIWELLYFLQFFALEFFFRGFMLHGTSQRFGFYSVFVMTIPYCMIHFGKPFPETLAAIIAGIVLGSLSLKSRSIWLGVAIHYSVAITMDVCSLYQRGFF